MKSLIPCPLLFHLDDPWIMRFRDSNPKASIPEWNALLWRAAQDTVGLIRVAPRLSLEDVLQCYVGDEHGDGRSQYASMERGMVGGGDGMRCPWLAKWVKYSRGSGVKRERADKEDIAREEKSMPAVMDWQGVGKRSRLINKLSATFPVYA